jgi:signal transduction histidine kinase
MSGGLFFWVAVESTNLQRDDVTQRLHRSLAGSLVKEDPLLRDGAVDPEALGHVFHTLMVVNPSIEVYLLDALGKVLRYSAPEGRVVLERVALAPIHEFLAGEASLPIWGDDPRHPATRKVFSAAPIETDSGLQGYLYIVLESELYASAAAGGWGRAQRELTLGGAAAILLFGIGSGIAVYTLLTRRLSVLAKEVAALRKNDFRDRPSGLVAMANPAGDEIERLAASFHEMGERIVEQVQALRDTDEHRRQLIANVSHDLRTPLAALEGYLETLLLKGQDVSEQERREYLEIARKSGARLSRLVDELFELATLEATSTAPNAEVFCIADLAHDVLQKFQLRAREAGVDLRVDIEPDADFANAEIGMIERVLENLIDNALRFTPSEGRVSLSVSRSDEALRIVIEDTGAGIPERDLPHIFDRFYRTDAQSDAAQRAGAVGAGLGLAIAKRIVELHSCTLRARSEIGVGTAFSFDLPAAA